MAKPKKTKHNSWIVMYVRVKPEEHTLIKEIAGKRGYPHTIASVSAEMISKGLKTEAETAQTEGRP